MSLDSGKKIYGNNWNILPITDEVINRVHLIAKEQKQKPIKNGNFEFEWAPTNNPIVYDSKWDEEDEELSVISAPVETPNDNPTIKNEYDGNPTILEYENNPIAVDTEAFNDNHTIQEQRSEIKEIIDNTGVSQIIVEEESQDAHKKYRSLERTARSQACRECSAGVGSSCRCSFGAQRQHYLRIAHLVFQTGLC